MEICQFLRGHRLTRREKSILESKESESNKPSPFAASGSSCVGRNENLDKIVLKTKRREHKPAPFVVFLMPSVNAAAGHRPAPEACRPGRGEWGGNSSPAP